MIINNPFTAYPAEINLPVFYDGQDSFTNQWIKIASQFVELSTKSKDGEDLLLEAADQADYLERDMPHGDKYPWVYVTENGSQIFFTDSERMDLVTRGLDDSSV
jgi:hypothetical protein